MRQFISWGWNKKIGKDTVIMNMQSATDCTSKKMGLCKLCKKCYAMKAERFYPKNLAYRRYQEQVWKSLSAERIAQYIVEFSHRKKKHTIKYLRFSEAGDFTTQADVDKMSRIADLLKAYRIRVYGYTMRKDLDYSQVSKNMVISGSSFMIHNNFKAVPETKIKTVCNGDCPNCKLCKVRGYKTIENRIH